MAGGGIEVEAGVGGWALTAKAFLPGLLCASTVPGRGAAWRGRGRYLTLGAGRALNF